MAHPNEELVREGVAAFQRGDLEALRDGYLAADVRWHVPGRGPLAGADQVIGLFVRVFEVTGGTYRIELHDVLANDEHAVALLTTRGERDGRQFTDNAVIVQHIKDSRAAEVWHHASDLYAQDDLLS
jgi:uncharacterized protein